MTLFPKKHDSCEKTDILILGAGLSGMRAGCAALENCSSLDVLMISNRNGPSGSSFANVHNRLGMVVCLDERDQEQFVQKAVAIAAPGRINTELTSMMASDSHAAFSYLEQLGFKFLHQSDGTLARVTPCFMPQTKLAVIIENLSDAYSRFKARFENLGGKFSTGQVLALVTEKADACHRMHGAVFIDMRSGQIRMIQAKAVVMALGGNASLYQNSVCGDGASGMSFAMLNRCGVGLINASYFQFLWHTVDTHTFFPIADLLGKSAVVLNDKGDSISVDDRLYDLSDSRRQHAPMAYGFHDARIDEFFLRQMTEKDSIMVRRANEPWIEISPMAHAGNGGAVIDRNGQTECLGLFACGECAGGMHGANRIGGAMVLATQVFGRRAGKAASEHAKCCNHTPRKKIISQANLLLQSFNQDDRSYASDKNWLGMAMVRHALFQRHFEYQLFQKACELLLEKNNDWRAKMLLESALLIIRKDDSNCLNRH